MAPRGVIFRTLNPGLPSLPDFKAGMAVTLALSLDGRTLLALTSGFKPNLDASGNVDPVTSNEYVFVYDVSDQHPAQTEVLPIEANAFDGLACRPDGKELYVSGGPDDLVHVFARGSGGWTESSSIPLNHNGVGLGLYGILPVVAGLAVSSGTLIFTCAEATVEHKIVLYVHVGAARFLLFCPSCAIRALPGGNCRIGGYSAP
jgi:hypothetical protein